MVIDIKANCIIIRDPDKSLGPVEKSQLAFWHFLHTAENEYSSPLSNQTFIKLLRYFDKETIHFSLSHSASIFSQELEVVDLEFNQTKKNAENYKNGQYDKLEFETFRSFVIDYIKRSLRIHQLKAAFHLYQIGNGANFSVPGSGKTTVVLTVYEKLRQEGKVNTLFVVGPPSCFGPWKAEFLETLGRTPSYTILAGGNKKTRKKNYYQTAHQSSELYLTTYQTLYYDQTDVCNFLKQRHINAFFIVDEAHYIKQINGNWSLAIMKQADKAINRCVLTGTPMPKSYTDIFNLFDFLWPNQHPISSSDKTLIKYNEEKHNVHSAKNILDQSIGPLFYRVRKSDLQLANQNFISPYIISMHKHEWILYNAVYKKIKDYSKKEYFKNVEFINTIGRGRIMRLRQLLSYPKLLNNAIDNYNEGLLDDLADLKTIIRQYDKLEVPAKIEFLLKKLKELKKQKLKVVIWSNFIGTIRLIEKHITDQKLKCKIIYGNTPIEGTNISDEETREKIRDEFVNLTSGLDILVANPAACAESISLHKTCHHAIYYDLSYNCAQYLQSLDRIHRVGGSETIEANYHFLQYKDTIDVDIKENIDRKTKKMYDIIENDYPIYTLDMFDADGDAEAYARLFKKNK